MDTNFNLHFSESWTETEVRDAVAILTKVDRAYAAS
jgi:hypothetical protein